MIHRVRSVYVIFQGLAVREDGQELIEYGLLTTLITLALVSSIGQIATYVANVFTSASNIF